jgi:Restriction Enzyme Adenine Methylase Associated
MSGQLDLSFSYLGGPEVGELPVVVDVVNANLETAVKPRSVRVDSGWQQDLEPGTYLARVRFPSGEVERQTCTVREGDRTQIWMDVHALSGHESLERPAVLRPFVRDESTPGLANTGFASAWVTRWRGEAGREWQQIDFDGKTVSRDDHTIRYHFDVDRQSNLLQLGSPGIRWRFVSLPPGSGVDVTVSPRGEDDLAVEVTTQSAEAEALLGYLRTGAVEGANATAEELLQQKLGDPIAAAIGGYYLLRAARLDRLSDWGPNLSEWFPWLADGAVINAWQHIHAGREHHRDSDQHFDTARRQLLLATQRGVPVYTEGLKLLVDGLRLLRKDAEADDPEADAALTFVEPFALAADWSAATVTYSGADPAEPQPSRRYGIPEDHERLVLLHQVKLQDLIELGWLSPGAQLVSSEWSSEATAIVTPNGFLNVTGLGTFQSPETTAKSALGLDHPSSAWNAWQVDNAGDAAPRAGADTNRLGQHPSLGDLRLAAQGED